MISDAANSPCAIQLPHRTGTQAHELRQDDVAVITRGTLVKLSASSVALVLESLLTLLEDLARPYKNVVSHPPHVLLSELYALELIADCCASHWRTYGAGSQDGQEADLSSRQRAQLPAPERLDDVLVSRIFEVIKLLFEPIPEGYMLPAKTILDESSSKRVAAQVLDESARTPVSSPSEEQIETSRLLRTHAAAVDSHVTTIVEYVTASSWSAAFDYFRNVIYTARAPAPPQGSPVSTAAAEEERACLVILRLVSSFWVDSPKLTAVIQEFCSSFLHFRKSFQNTMAIVTLY